MITFLYQSINSITIVKNAHQKAPGAEGHVKVFISTEMLETANTFFMLKLFGHANGASDHPTDAETLNNQPHGGATGEVRFILWWI